MSIRKFLKNYILEQDENLVSIPAEEYKELVDYVGGIAERIAKLKPYKNKGIVIIGDLDVSGNKTIGPLTGVVRITGRLDISASNVPHLNGITVDGYTNMYNSTMYIIEQKRKLNLKLEELNEKRLENEWDVSNSDDESERTEALYEYLKDNGELESFEDENGDEQQEDKYFIYPNGGSGYGGKNYEWLGGKGGINPNTYDVYEADEIDSAAVSYLEQLIDDVGYDAFSSWVWNDNLNQKQWEQYLYDYYEDDIRSRPEDFNINLSLSSSQMAQLNQLNKVLTNLNSKLENEDLEDEEYENIENKIEGLEETIQEIKDDPQGDYDESEIENEINGRVDEWSDDISGYIKEFGMDKSFILDFVDIEDIAQTVVSSDGYGSVLNSYDGSYDTVYVNNNEYYVLRRD